MQGIFPLGCHNSEEFQDCIIVCACVCVCVHACVRACVRMRAYVSARAWWRFVVHQRLQRQTPGSQTPSGANV